MYMNMDFSQLRMGIPPFPPPPLSFDPVFKKDAECAVTNEKLTFRFVFFELSWKFIENLGDLHFCSKNWKNEIEKIKKLFQNQKLALPIIWTLSQNIIMMVIDGVKNNS